MLLNHGGALHIGITRALAREYSPRNMGASNVDEEERCSSHLIEWDSWFDEDNDIDNLSSSESGSESSESDE